MIKKKKNERNLMLTQEFVRDSTNNDTLVYVTLLNSAVLEFDWRRRYLTTRQCRW